MRAMGRRARPRDKETCTECLTHNRNYYFVSLCQRACLASFEWVMLILGPCLILTVMGLAGCESYWALKHLVPQFAPVGSLRWGVHAVWVAWLVTNVLFNYLSCVTTNPGTHTSAIYTRLTWEASESGAVAKADWEDYALARGFSTSAYALSQQGADALLTPRQRRVAPELDRHARQSWIDRDPYEWGFCKRSMGPKAPRSHYDHVTHKLVLNMDHYCPWMFNVVGFANYRYFVLFLFYVATACVYGLSLTAEPILVAGKWIARREGRQRLSQSARSAVLFTFALSLSVGIAVSILFGWHVYLVLTSQTTIEFYGNHSLKIRARARGGRFRNPYDRGTRRNWQQVFGTRHPILAILPSWRPPPGRPWPSADGDEPDGRLDVV